MVFISHKIGIICLPLWPYMMKMKATHRNLTFKETAEHLHVSESTIHNWVKEGFLILDEQRLVTQKSIRKLLSRQTGKQKLQARANKLFKDPHDDHKVRQQLESLMASLSTDALSHGYETLLAESFKNKEGIFYTPMDIVGDMMKTIEILPSSSFLDPCCGSGNFLVKAIMMGVRPENLYGFDTDANAVMIAQRRVRELTGKEAAHVVCADFLQECPKLDAKFDFVFTNPPWGKKLHKQKRLDYARQYQAGNSTDTCSLFLFAILSKLRPDGVMGLLMPESFYNIAVYEDARKAVLDKTILSMKDYGKPFKNMYSAVAITIKQRAKKDNQPIVCQTGGRTYVRQQDSFLSMPRCNLNYWTSSSEMQMLTELMRNPSLSLKGHAIWGMGIVTGNNAKMCKHSYHKGLKPVYRGKDLLPGRMKAASLFINPKDFPRYQQMAPLELFHATEKLVYRFISNTLVFVCDTKQRYILNSANMFILDEAFPLTAKQLAELMNSTLTNWVFRQLFHTHKVLRGDLELLPIFTDLSLHRRFNLVNLDR